MVARSVGVRAIRWRRVVAAAVAAASCLVAGPACADGWGAAIGWSSDRIYRGISQSGDRPAFWFDVQAHTDTGWSIAAAGSLIASPLAPASLGDLSVSVARGVQIDDDWSAQLGAVHIAYPGPRRRRLYDHDEAVLGLDWRGQGHAALALSPDTTGRTDPTHADTGWAAALDVGWHQRLVDRLAVDVGIGRTVLHANGHHASYGSLGLSSGWGAAQVSVSYIATSATTDRDGVAPLVGRRWTASVGWGF